MLIGLSSAGEWWPSILADELAEDSNDEKHLEKAEKAAERNTVKRKRKHTELISLRCVLRFDELSKLCCCDIKFSLNST